MDIDIFGEHLIKCMTFVSLTRKGRYIFTNCTVSPFLTLVGGCDRDLRDVTFQPLIYGSPSLNQGQNSFLQISH